LCRQGNPRAIVAHRLLRDGMAVEHRHGKRYVSSLASVAPSLRHSVSPATDVQGQWATPRTPIRTVPSVALPSTRSGRSSSTDGRARRTSTADAASGAAAARVSAGGDGVTVVSGFPPDGTSAVQADAATSGALLQL
jgi:hypothetical protein